MQASFIRRVVQRRSIITRQCCSYLSRVGSSQSGRSLNSKALTLARNGSHTFVSRANETCGRRRSWRRNGGQSWWESLIRSVNRRCLLCAGAVFLWDRERFTNHDMENRLRKYERQYCTSNVSLLAAPSIQPHPVDPPTESRPSDYPAVNEECATIDRDVENNYIHDSHQEEDDKLMSGPSSDNGTSQCEHDLNDQQYEVTDNSTQHSYLYRLYHLYEYLYSFVPMTAAVQRKDVIKQKEVINNRQEVGEAELDAAMNEEKSDNDDTFVDCSVDLNNGEQQLEQSEIFNTVEAFDDVIEVRQNDISKKEMEISFTNKDSTTKAVLTTVEDPLEGWEFMLEQDQCKVYYKPYENTGLYQYKVIGSYNDITARDFHDVQVSIDDRKEWDSYVLKLETVDKDKSTGSEIIHWILKYPFPMCNREYVFVRRSWISQNDDAIVILSRSVDHPDVPENNKYVRVKKYYSEMVIKPFTFINELGLNYELTYFDDPGTMLPSSAVTWVSKSAMPDFLKKIHSAALRKNSYSNQSQRHKNIA